jgi:uncharacterized protein (DUF2126 family)/transglutaminase-like putative cysteine protease
MAIRVALNHETRYKYARPALLSPQVVRLRPAPHVRTPVQSYSLRIEPTSEHFLNWVRDPHGNFVARVVVPKPTTGFSVNVELVAELEAFNPFDFFLEPWAEKFPFQYPPELRKELEPYLVTEPLTPLLADFIRTCAANGDGDRSVDFLVKTNRRLFDAVRYLIRMEPGVQTPEQTLSLASGSCRDSAWLLVQVMRNLGLAARFVSGYLIQLVPDQPPTNGARGPERDFCDLHAWCECFVPGAGWIGLDPTSGLLAAEGHIPLACASIPASAAPIEGGVEQVDTEFDFAMSVKRLDEEPRATLPYTNATWQRILAVGEAVDRSLYRGDARLTMGGEPTFVSMDDRDAPEWNTAALGGTKLRLADRLLRRLQARWHAGGLLFHGQGKWYPGEPLPRWALACFFRRDGAPLWTDASLIAASDHDYGHDSELAERFARRLAARLGLAKHGLMPAYEDVWYYMWRERRLPRNVNPLDARLGDKIEAERLTRVFGAGLGSVTGWVLPLRHDGLSWLSGHWFLRDEHCFLLPGDSPMGFRLPLDSLPWMSEGDAALSPDVERDPFDDPPPLPARYDFPLRTPEYVSPAVKGQRPGADLGPDAGAKGNGGGARSPFDAPSLYESATGVVRTALCIEARGGTLRLFMPPLYSLEAFVELVAGIEATTAELGCKVQLEGYSPPRDPRLGHFSLSPDPGVIEVNVAPVDTFAELVDQTESLYECARLEGLVPDKFELDGTHVGSGGGHHLAMGAASAGDSPFFRNPDVLASLIGFVNNHPSLSYLFSGRFIGPTSQAPRIDEARHESVHEMELAFTQLPRRGQQSMPWLVDRALRHLLVDLTGNTHRAEFCIDKLYSPDGPTGRLGIVELRGFEMAPHPKTAIAQQLLARALFARFWQEPYRAPLVKWGTIVHDRFMLPEFVWQDFLEVVHDLRDHGFAVEADWFEPHFEFRFPRYGELVRNGVVVELRAALEPWPVLGEESSGGAQARYVDSSLERLQILVRGMTDTRHSVCCNGIELPLWPTGTAGEKVCGIRYRAWQPPSALHPMIGVHAPLHFDLYDAWNERAVAGFSYHVSHPGGRANEDRPINAVAAEGRRLARFDVLAHTPGRFTPLPAAPNPGFPMTLDLRRVSMV